jgi:TonB family protein
MKTRLTSAFFVAAVFGTSALTSLLAANYDKHDRHPQAISTPAPTYRYDLRRAEIEGAVLVSFNVTAQGAVTDAVVVKSTDLVFEEPTLQAVKKWKFAPAIIDGHAAMVPAMQLVTFSVTGRNPETPTIALVQKMKNRSSDPSLALAKIASTNLCFCESGKVYNDCHGHGG